MNGMPMLLGPATQFKLYTVTYKNPENPVADLRSLDITTPLISKLNHLCYEPDNSAEFFFPPAELVQIYRNLGLSPRGSTYSALCRA